MPLSFLGVYAVNGQIDWVWLAAAWLGWGVGGLVSPDLDHVWTTNDEWRVYRFSKVLGMVWHVVWIPYARFVPHRHWLSHGPIVGVLGRMLYLLVPTVLVLLPLGWGDDVVRWLWDHRLLVAIFLVCQEAAVEISHLWVDAITSFINRRRRKVYESRWR